jgi:hypothetical protein
MLSNRGLGVSYPSYRIFLLAAGSSCFYLALWHDFRRMNHWFDNGSPLPDLGANVLASPEHHWSIGLLIKRSIDENQAIFVTCRHFNVTFILAIVLGGLSSGISSIRLLMRGSL